MSIRKENIPALVSAMARLGRIELPPTRRERRAKRPAAERARKLSPDAVEKWNRKNPVPNAEAIAKRREREKELRVLRRQYREAILNTLAANTKPRGRRRSHRSRTKLLLCTRYIDRARRRFRERVLAFGSPNFGAIRRAWVNPGGRRLARNQRFRPVVKAGE